MAPTNRQLNRQRLEKLWPGCINGAVSPHYAQALPWAPKGLGPQPIEGAAMTQALVN